MRRSNPATIPQKTVYPIHDDEEEADPLQKQFKILEKEWDSIKQSISRSNRQSSTTAVTGDHRLRQPYDDSPKALMSLLQNEVETIEQPEGESFDFDEESEVSTEFGYMGFEDYDGKDNGLSGFSGGSCSGSPRDDVAERGGMVAVKGGRGGSGGGGIVGKWLVSVVVMLFALAIVALECSSEHKSVLVPT